MDLLAQNSKNMVFFHKKIIYISFKPFCMLYDFIQKIRKNPRISFSQNLKNVIFFQVKPLLVQKPQHKIIFLQMQLYQFFVFDATLTT